MTQLLYSRTLGWTSEDCPYQLVQNFFGLSVVTVNCPPRSRWLRLASYVHPIHSNHPHPLCFRKCISLTYLGFPDSSVGKESACNAGDLGSIPGLGKSPGEGIGYPLWYSCLENPMDRGAWWAHKEYMGSQRVGHDWAIKHSSAHSWLTVLWVSGEQRRDSTTHIHASILPQTPLPSRLPPKCFIFEVATILW